MSKQRAAIFASGTGSNFEAIMAKSDLACDIVLLVCDKPGATVIEKAHRKEVPTYVFEPKKYASKEAYEQKLVEKLRKEQIDWIFLAGYMRIVGPTKGITSAYLPLSATAVKKEIFEAFKGTDEYNHFRHVNTYGGNPAACAVALKNIEIFEKENLVERAAALGEKLLEEMAELEKHPNVGDVRGKGFLFGIELVEDKVTKEPAHREKHDKIIGICKKEGLIIGKNGDTVAGFNNILQLSPPLSMTDDDLKFIVNTVKKAFAQL